MRHTSGHSYCILIIQFIEKENTVELYISGLTETTNHPDMQKIRIIGFFFENRIHWRFEAKNKRFINDCFRLHIYLRTNKALLRNSLYVSYVYWTVHHLDS